jgi:hypothetical protein
MTLANKSLKMSKRLQHGFVAIAAIGQALFGSVDSPHGERQRRQFIVGVDGWGSPDIGR